MLKNKKMQSGFTLVELMVAIGILAILAAMAYPTYQNFIIRGHMDAARGEMMDNIRMMEKFYAENHTMCVQTNADGTCKEEIDTQNPDLDKGMPEPIANPQADSYDTTIRSDKFNGSRGNSYIIVSKPNSKSGFAGNTNKEIYLLYYSNGSGFVKCTHAAWEKAKNAKPDDEDEKGCSAM